MSGLNLPWNPQNDRTGLAWRRESLPSTSTANATSSLIKYPRLSLRILDLKAHRNGSVAQDLPCQLLVQLTTQLQNSTPTIQYHPKTTWTMSSLHCHHLMRTSPSTFSKLVYRALPSSMCPSATLTRYDACLLSGIYIH